MKFFYEGNPDLRSTTARDIKSRLLYFSKQHYIGSRKFTSEVLRGRNLLALSSWLAGEFCKNTHPIPVQFTEPTKPITEPTSNLFLARQGIEPPNIKGKQGTLFDLSD